MYIDINIHVLIGLPTLFQVNKRIMDTYKNKIEKNGSDGIKLIHLHKYHT